MEEANKKYSSPYLKHSLDGLQRLVSLTNLDKLSSTYGCSHRDYWLYKTSDFSDAVRNFSSNAFALASVNPCFNLSTREFFSELAKGSILFWTKIQHNDGSFDEFYPYERGWVGPTAFTLYSNIEAYHLIHNKLTPKEKDLILNSFNKASKYIAQGDKEGDHLANHHAMAYLALTKSYEILDNQVIKKESQKSFNNYLKYHVKEEGWSIEYDGIDPGYLSASCSFLSKTLDVDYKQDIIEIIKIYSKTLKSFCYPDGCFSGPIGSRNTMHLYPFAFELLAEVDENIKYLANFSQFSLQTGNAITPNLMSDRYVHYRVEEYLATDKLFLDKKATIKTNFEINSQETFLPRAGIYHYSDRENFITANLCKNLVLDFYNKKKDNNWQRVSFTGIRILDKNGLYSSQFISKESNLIFNKNKLISQGYLAKIPTENSFNIIKNLIFRVLLLLCSKSTFASNILKKGIRKFLMYSKTKENYFFKISLDKEIMELEINIKANKKAKPLNLQFGSTISDRYVPQSRFARISDQNLSFSLISEKTKEKIISKLLKEGFFRKKIKLNNLFSYY